MNRPEPPLEGTLVLSVGHTLPGLYCIAMLRDLGAEVVRVERIAPPGEPGPYATISESYPTRSLTAGTGEVSLDLKQEGGRAAFLRMAGRATVILEGFRPGVASRLGIDYDTLAAEHPKLVYAAISGYGQTGPLRARVGHDVNYLADTGVLGLSNPQGLPGTTFADGLAGVSAALNVVAALSAASRSGLGQYLDLAIVDGPLFLMASEFEHLWLSGRERSSGDTHLTGRYPWYGLHATKDGGAMAVGAIEPAFHTALCRRLGHPELAATQFPEGVELEQMREAYAAAFGSQARNEAETLFDGEDTCVTPVLSTAEVAASPLMERAQRTGSERGEKLVRSPIRLTPATLANERTAGALLARFGFSREEIKALERAGAMGGEG